MLNTNDSQVKLERYYSDCVRFQSKQKDVNDEKEAIRRALEYAIDNHLFEEDGDEKYVDYVEEIDEEDYHDAIGK